MRQFLQRYVDFIKNTDPGPLPVWLFDLAHAPVGPIVREEMEGDGLIRYEGTGDTRVIHLRR